MYRPNGRYWYTWGISTYQSILSGWLVDCRFEDWRALVAMLLTVPPGIPGLAKAITPSIPAGGTTHLYVSDLTTITLQLGIISTIRMMLQDIAFIFGCVAGGAIYWILSFIFPAQGTFVEETISELDVDSIGSREVTVDDKPSEEYDVKLEKA